PCTTLFPYTTLFRSEHYLLGLRERRRMTEPNKCTSFSTFKPARSIFCIVLLLILAPYVPTTIGFITSIALPRIGLSLRMCSRRRILPPGLHTRRISFIPCIGSGTEQYTHVATIKSNVLFSKNISCASISSNFKGNDICLACLRAWLNLPLLKSIPVSWI